MKMPDILLLYHYDVQNAGTITEHIASFHQHSSFSVEAVNVAQLESPNVLRRMDYQVAVLHYTLFGMQYYLIPEDISYIIANSSALKVAFFQDEYYNVPKRFRYIDEYDIDIVYTLVEPSCFRPTFYKYTKAPVVLCTLPGYVSADLLANSERFARSNGTRPVDVGYRGRKLDPTLGSEGLEKHRIATEFMSRTQGMGLVRDVETEDRCRIYGEAWPAFIASCKAVLGVEAGIAIFDFEDKARLAVKKLRRERPDLSAEQVYEAVVRPVEEARAVGYRQLSPRHFEAAALGTCQILFRGRYSGIMEPDVHYIPLEKDFSNFDEAMEKFRDEGFRGQVTENAYRDLIASGRYSYEQFIKDFDVQIKLMGCCPGRGRG